MARDRRHLRHLGRRDERGGAGRRLCRGRRRGRAGGARGVLAARVGRGALQPAPARPARDRCIGPLDARQLAGLRRDGPRWRACSRPTTSNPAGSNPLREILRESVDFERLGAVADQAVHHRHQRAHRPRPRLPQRRDHARRAAGLGLPADDVPGGRDRRRALLGRRLLRQPDDDAAGPRVHGARHHPGPDQPDRAAGHAAHARATSSTG